MKKLIFISIFSLLVIPSITFAAWWNPLTWKVFQKNIQSSQTKDDQLPAALEVASTSNPVVVEISTTTATSSYRSEELIPSKDSLKPSSPSQRTVPKKVLDNRSVISKVKPSVIFIETNTGSGSGFSISSNLIITNYHVIDGSKTIKVKTSDDFSFTAIVLGYDQDTDIALLQIYGDVDLASVTLGDSDKLSQGDRVFTFGYPFGLEGDVSFKEGTLSRVLRDGSSSFLEVSAEIHPGNSGGPLVNEFGEVVGINRMVFGKSIKGIQVGETIKLAIPINQLKKLLPSLKQGIQKTSLPTYKSVSFTQEQKESYDLFVRNRNKIFNDIIAGIKTASDSREASSLDDANKASILAGEAGALFSTAITDSNSLLENYPKNLVFSEDTKRYATTLNIFARKNLEAMVQWQIRLKTSDVGINAQNAYLKEKQAIEEAGKAYELSKARWESLEDQAGDFFGI
jgi:S1-C subfamily serine protease